MFDELYKKAMDEVRPDELLIRKTKNAMNKELNNKYKKFYKYGAVAACLIITFSLFRVSFDSMNSTSDSADFTKGVVMEELNSGARPVLNEGNSTHGIPIDINFSAESSDMASTDSIMDKLFGWIGDIIDWFKNLF